MTHVFQTVSLGDDTTKAIGLCQEHAARHRPGRAAWLWQIHTGTEAACRRLGVGQPGARLTPFWQRPYTVIQRFLNHPECANPSVGVQDALGSRRACEDAVIAALAAGAEVVVDRCNFDEQQRLTWVALARRCRAVPIGLQLQVPLEECIRRVCLRTDHPTLAAGNAPEVIARWPPP